MVQEQKSSSFLYCKNILSKSWFIPVCFIIYMALRIALLIAVPISQYSDNLWYMNRGIAIAAGQGYSENGISTAYWPVGWPGILGILFVIFGPSPVVGQIANLMFTAATFFLTLRLGSIIFKNELVGRLSVLLLTFYPNQIAYVPVLSTEIFYTTLLLLAIYMIVDTNKVLFFIISGLLFGFATLTKTQSIFIPVIVISVWAYTQKETFSSYLRKLIFVGLAMIAVIAPWTYRNYLIFHELVPVSTNGGLTLLTGNNPSANGDFTPDDPLVKRVPRDVESQVQADRLATALVLDWIKNHPKDFARLLPKKVWRLWAPDGEGEWSYQAGFKNYEKYSNIFRMVRIFNQLYYFLILLTFFSSIYYIWRNGKKILPYCGTGYIFVVYFTIISVVFSGQSRFHYLLMPWIIMYGSYAILGWWRERSIRLSSAAIREW